MEARPPELLHTSFSPELINSDNINTTNNGGGDHFTVEDLFDFFNEDGIITDGTFDSNECSNVAAVDSSCNSSSFSGCEPNQFPDGRFSGDIGVPYDDLAHLEWLSNFVEESFSSDDLQKLQLISGMKAPTDEASETRAFQPESNRNSPMFNSELLVPAKARSKRSRAPPCSWTSRLLVLTPTESEVVVPTPQSFDTVKKPGKPTMQRKKENGDGASCDGLKCLHCATDKTPQWRTGPMGPKTLCNACGVRYKSGRLVAEYRPAASPTFMLTKHSNSHRKVLELRRQKEMMRTQQMQQQQFLHQQGMMFDVSNGGDYLIHQHVGPDYRQII